MSDSKLSEKAWKELWAELEKQGWHYEMGPFAGPHAGRKQPYFFPPGISRVQGYRERVDYFDSRKQVLRHLRDTKHPLAVSSEIVGYRRSSDFSAGNPLSRPKKRTAQPRMAVDADGIRASKASTSQSEAQLIDEEAFKVCPSDLHMIQSVNRLKQILEEETSDDKVMSILEQLNALGRLSLPVLRTTLIGKSVVQLRSSTQNEEIREKSKSLLATWKCEVKEVSATHPDECGGIETKKAYLVLPSPLRSRLPPSPVVNDICEGTSSVNTLGQTPPAKRLRAQESVDSFGKDVQTTNPKDDCSQKAFVKQRDGKTGPVFEAHRACGKSRPFCNYVDAWKWAQESELFKGHPKPENVKIKPSVAFLRKKPCHDSSEQVDATATMKSTNADVVGKKAATATSSSTGKVGSYGSSASLLERKEESAAGMALVPVANNVCEVTCSVNTVGHTPPLKLLGAHEFVDSDGIDAQTTNPKDDCSQMAFVKQLDGKNGPVFEARRACGKSRPFCNYVDAWKWAHESELFKGHPMPERVKIKSSVAFLCRKSPTGTIEGLNLMNADVVGKSSATATCSSKDNVGGYDSSTSLLARTEESAAGLACSVNTSASVLERKEDLRSRVDQIIQFVEQKCSHENAIPLAIMADILTKIKETEKWIEKDVSLTEIDIMIDEIDEYMLEIVEALN